MRLQRLSAFVLGLILFAALLGCGSKPPAEESAQPTPAPSPGTTTSEGTNAAGTTTSSGTKAPSMTEKLQSLTKRSTTVPQGTVLHVRLNETLSSKSSSPGQSFSAVVDEPITISGKVAIPKGAEATGTVVDAKALGKFKGAARLQIRLESIGFGGNSYHIDSSSVARTAKGKGKRTAVMVGGGAGLGALIGGLAGGGKGAGIGALVGAGAGTGGAYFTGNKDVVLPAETMLAFRLLKPIEVK
ncbi:MAG: hypothetical protein M3P27_10170 [Acidobacteriota bacterium]|nr:hypothetical protein [Acidobacteriota bacterium]